MKEKKRRTFSLASLKKAEFMAILSLVAFGGILAAGTLFTSVEDVLSQVSKVSWEVILAVLFLPLLNTLVRSYRWHIFGERLEMKVPPLRMLLYYFAGISMLLTPGKVGTGLRLWLLNKCHNISYKKGLPLMIMDPLVDLAALFLLCLAGMAGFASKGAAIAVFGLILGGAVLLFARPKFFAALVKLVYRVFGKRKKRLFGSLLKVVRHITYLMNLPTFLKTVSLSFLGWLFTIWAFYLVVGEFGFPITFEQATFVFSFSVILGGATMAPGGLGGTEASMFALLLTLGVPADAAVAAVMVTRIGTLWFGVLLGFAALPFALKVARKV